jgi:hypothetical protein
LKKDINAPDGQNLHQLRLTKKPIKKMNKNDKPIMEKIAKIGESKEYIIGASPPKAGNNILAGHIWQAGRKSSF